MQLKEYTPKHPGPYSASFAPALLSRVLHQPCYREFCTSPAIASFAPALLSRVFAKVAERGDH